MMELIDQFEQALRDIDSMEAKKLFLEACKNNSVSEVAEMMISPALEHIGDDWSKGTVALSQVYMSGRICEEVVDSMIPHLSELDESKCEMAITTLDDYHLLGKRIVYSSLRAQQFKLIDYGRKSVDALVEQVKKDEIKILLISALMLPSALKVAKVRERLDSSIAIIVGGAPFNFDSELWKEVKADRMGKSANEAIRIITEITGGNP